MSDTAYRLILAALEAEKGKSTAEMAREVARSVPNANPVLITAALQATAGKRVATQATAIWRVLMTGQLPVKPQTFRLCGSVPASKDLRGKPAPAPRPTHARVKPPPPKATALTIEARRERVRKLAAEGLSQREIAEVIGISQSTAGKDLRAMVQEEAAGA